jgi:hypothetical protein
MGQVTGPNLVSNPIRRMLAPTAKRLTVDTQDPALGDESNRFEGKPGENFRFSP